MNTSFSLIKAFLALAFLFSGIAAAVVFTPLLLTLSPDRPGCDVPIRYRVEAPDPRFPLDFTAFRNGVFEAEAVWERGIGKDLFAYDPDAPFVIRTEFDARQKMTSEASDLKRKISTYESASETLRKEYDAAAADHKKKTAAFKVAADAFSKKLAEYNADVKEWNASGTGTAEEYDALEKRRKKLEKDERSLSAISKDIDRLTTQVNALAEKLNRNTADINRNIGTFRERYGEPTPFIQGLYDPEHESITIFQFEDRDDLRLVLAHELGHALGIETHMESASSIMHYLMGGQSLEHPTLSTEDVAAYDTACPDRIFSKRETLVRYLTATQFKDMNAWDIAGILMQK